MNNNREFRYTLEAYDYLGTLVDAELEINIRHYQAPTPGNFSPIAGDPSEFFGDDEEVEWDVVSAKLVYEDGHEVVLVNQDAAKLSFSDAESERITNSVLEQIRIEDDADNERSYIF